jgi:hypothetical protein
VKEGEREGERTRECVTKSPFAKAMKIV